MGFVERLIEMVVVRKWSEGRRKMGREGGGQINGFM